MHPYANLTNDITVYDMRSESNTSPCEYEDYEDSPVAPTAPIEYTEEDIDEMLYTFRTEN